MRVNRAVLRAVTAASAALALVGGSLALAAPAAAKSSSSAPRVSFAFYDNGAVTGSNSSGVTTAGVVLSVTKASSVARSVRIRTGGGSADPATEYTAIDQRLTIPAGATSVGFRIPIQGIAEEASPTHFYVGLSSPSSGVKLGLLRLARVTIYPGYGPPPLGGSTWKIHDFESGVPDDVAAFSSRPAVRPQLSTARADVPGSIRPNRGLLVRVERSTRASDSLGFRTVQPSSDLGWPAVGPTLEFKGTGTGGRVSIVLRNGSQVFEYGVANDATGWRSLTPAFDDFRLLGNPSSDARYDSSDYTGYEVRLTGVKAGRYLFDDPSIVFVY